ncbi:MAG: phage integrase SAM-like domain-containing protein [Jejuia sp.]
MANVKTALDTRRAKSDGTYNVIYRITHEKKIYTINSGVVIRKEFWEANKSEISKKHPNSRLLNLKILKSYYKIQEALLKLEDDFSINKLRANLGYSTKADCNLTFKQFSDKIIAQMIEAKRTGNAIVYRTAVKRLIEYSGEHITFDDVDFKLLTQFEHKLKTDGLKRNSISNYFRSIRALYNLAIKHKLVDRSKYPFHDITIKSQRTASRAITKANIKKLNSLSLEVDSSPWKALQYFMLSFYLRGASFTDIAYLRQSNIINGRIEYKRRKTHKHYSIKLFPKAETIIKSLHNRNNKYLLPVLPNNIAEDSLEAKRIIQQWIETTNKHLKRFSGGIKTKVVITTYTSRYSFAQIAKHLGYSNELIAEALGHEYGNRVTNTYLDAFDTNTLDAMHCKVISMK